MNHSSPVVMIHGMWSTPEVFQDLKLEFEEQGFDVHTPALPNHVPMSEMTPERIEMLRKNSITDYVNSLISYIKKLKEPPILIGHSMGGLLAQLVAAKIPCSKIVLLSSAAPAGINSWSISVLRTFGKNLLLFPLWKKHTQIKLNNIRYGIANSHSPEVHEEISKLSTYESGLATWQISMWPLYLNPPTLVDETKIQCPVLIISGKKDKITPIKIQRRLAKKYADSELIVIDDACHWILGGTHLTTLSRHILNMIKR